MLKKTFFASLAFLISITQAHMQMRSPAPRWSKYNNWYSERNQINYNLNSPLNVQPDFFTFPCKGFLPSAPTTVLRDNTIKITLEGTATHEGGHCQFGITLDNINFLVLQTITNNCLINSLEYTMTLPNGMPQSNFTVFWSWINKIGNREYYMDCADVSLMNGNTNRIPFTIYGKSLLVVNLPGYPIIPEFSESSAYNGQDLLDNRRNIALSITYSPHTPNTTTTTTRTTTTTTIQPPNTTTTTTRTTTTTTIQPPNITTTTTRTTTTTTIQPPNITTTTTRTATTTTILCQNGHMRCYTDPILNTHYNVCDNGMWRDMPCPLGTKCTTIDASTISCGF
jgi:hypothetical protein